MKRLCHVCLACVLLGALYLLVHATAGCGGGGGAAPAGDAESHWGTLIWDTGVWK